LSARIRPSKVSVGFVCLCRRARLSASIDSPRSFATKLLHP